MLRSWIYRDDNNCWDFVRHKMAKKGIELLSFDVDPEDEEAVNIGYKKTIGQFVECGRDEGALACHYRGDVFIHVGIVIGGKVHHANKNGYRVNNFKTFERLAKTRYLMHVDLKNT